MRQTAPEVPLCPPAPQLPLCCGLCARAAAELPALHILHDTVMQEHYLWAPHLRHLPLNADLQQASAPKSGSLPYPASCGACQRILCRHFATKTSLCLQLHTRQHGPEDVSLYEKTLHIRKP